jgi:hypothetical protein
MTGLGSAFRPQNKAHSLFRLLTHDHPSDRSKHTIQSFASQRFGWHLSTKQTEFLTIYHQDFGFYECAGMMFWPKGRVGKTIAWQTHVALPENALQLAVLHREVWNA